MSHYSLSCHSSTFKHRSPEKKNCSGSSLGGQKQDSVGARREEAQERLFLVQLNTSMGCTKRPEVIGHVLVCSQFKDELRIPRWVKKESAGRCVHPSRPVGVLGSSRLVWCLVELAASSALPYIVSATRQILGVTHCGRGERCSPALHLLSHFSSDFLSPVLQYFTARVM